MRLSSLLRPPVVVALPPLPGASSIRVVLAQRRAVSPRPVMQPQLRPPAVVVLVARVIKAAIRFARRRMPALARQAVLAVEGARPPPRAA